MTTPDVVPLTEEVIDLTMGGVRADRALRRVLRAHPELTSDARAQVATWSLGLCVWRGRIDLLARGRRELWLPLFLIDRLGLPLAEAASLCEQPPEALQFEPPSLVNDVEALAFRRSLPTWLAARWIEVFGAERADRLAEAMNEPGPVSIRANRLRISAGALLRRLHDDGIEASSGLHARDALTLMGRPNITGLAAWREGLFEVQDEGSQLIAEAVDASAGQMVVDLCAGAGGKTLALAAAMGDRGRLIAVEPDVRRVADLRGRLGRVGVTCVEVRAGDATDAPLLADLDGKADAVLVDAPCSELGTLRRGPDARWRIEPDASARWAVLQRGLLARAAALVRPGGRLVYATCSLDPTENEQVATTLPSDVFEPMRCRTLAPDVEGTDGFFLSVWRRRLS